MATRKRTNSTATIDLTGNLRNSSKSKSKWYYNINNSGKLVPRNTNSSSISFNSNSNNNLKPSLKNQRIANSYARRNSKKRENMTKRKTKKNGNKNNTNALKIEDASSDILRNAVYDCIQYLTENKAINDEGIFRISGNTQNYKHLIQHLLRDYSIHIFNEPGLSNNDVASALKQLIREAKEPLISLDLYTKLKTIITQEPQPQDINSQLQSLFTEKFETDTFQILTMIMKYLKKVSSNSAINEMTASNLATVFAPTLLPPTIPLTEYKENAVITYLITHWDKISRSKMSNNQ